MKLGYQIANQELTVSLSGDFVGYDDEAEKTRLFKTAEQAKFIRVVDDGLQKWDSTLVVILYHLAKTAKIKKREYDFSSLPKNLQTLIGLALEVDRKPGRDSGSGLPWLAAFGDWGLKIYQSLLRAWKFVMTTFHSFVRLIAGSAVMRKVDFLFALEDSSYKAVGIVTLVSFMVGLILSALSSLKLSVRRYMLPVW